MGALTLTVKLSGVSQIKIIGVLSLYEKVKRIKFGWLNYNYERKNVNNCLLPQILREKLGPIELVKEDARFLVKNVLDKLDAYERIPPPIMRDRMRYNKLVFLLVNQIPNISNEIRRLGDHSKRELNCIAYCTDLMYYVPTGSNNIVYNHHYWNNDDNTVGLRMSWSLDSRTCFIVTEPPR